MPIREDVSRVLKLGKGIFSSKASAKKIHSREMLGKQRDVLDNSPEYKADEYIKMEDEFFSDFPSDDIDKAFDLIFRSDIGLGKDESASGLVGYAMYFGERKVGHRSGAVERFLGKVRDYELTNKKELHATMKQYFKENFEILDQLIEKDDGKSQDQISLLGLLIFAKNVRFWSDKGWDLVAEFYDQDKIDCLEKFCFPKLSYIQYENQLQELM